MKNKVGMGALCVLLVLFAAGVSGCKNDDDGNSWISTMGAPGIGDIKSLSFEGGSTVVKDYEEARSLVQSFFYNDYEDDLDNAKYEAFYKAFKAKFGKEDYLWYQDQGKSYSYSVDVNDTDVLVAEVDTVKAGTIKGSEKASWSHSRMTVKEYSAAEQKLEEEGIPYEENGDKITWSSSEKYTFSVTSGYFSAGSYKIAGIVKRESSNKWEKTTQKKSEDLYPESYSNKNKTAGALLIDNGLRAAKIRFSTAGDTTGKKRSTGWIGTSNNADVEVWSLDGATKLYTIPASVIFN